MISNAPHPKIFQRLLQVFSMSLLLLAAAGLQAEESIVTTKAGKLRGFQEDGSTIHVFRGIHYGQDTGGARRFKPALPVAPWDGIRDADRFGDVCPQTGNGGRTSKQQKEPIPMSEDCLVLNLWTPGFTGKRPVMVWLHGRGYAAGAGSEEWYDGTNLAKRGDVVVITINHRLNVFGHLYLKEIAGDEFAASGLVGLLDAQLALQWVRDNIAAFGGDPNNVTIFGESGGGSKVATMMGIPSAKGLFHKGIIESGPSRTATPADKATANARRAMEAAGVNTAQQLQALPFSKLLAATDKAGLVMAMQPVVDGTYLPDNMFDGKSAPSAVGVPMMVGSNRDEQILFTPNVSRDMTEADLLKTIRETYGDDAEFIIGEYRRSRPQATPWELYIAIGSARFNYRSIQLAEIHQASAPVYLYQFEFEVNDRFRATHSTEIRFVFSSASTRPNARPGAKKVEDAMSEAWIAFARNSNPNHPGIPHWPVYDLKDRTTMVFNVESRAVKDLRSIERLAHEKVGLGQ